MYRITPHILFQRFVKQGESLLLRQSNQEVSLIKAKYSGLLIFNFACGQTFHEARKFLVGEETESQPLKTRCFAVFLCVLKPGK